MKKDFLSILDLTPNELDELFVLADTLRKDTRRHPLEGKTAALIFQKPSLRTRVSFEVGIYQLGGHPIFLSQEGIGLGQRESASDVAKLLSRYNHLIVARLFDHQLLLDLASYSDIPVINALTDLNHPCQILADMYTIRQHGKLRKGVKVAFIGDGNNVVNSWLEVAALYPMHFVLAAPKGYDPDKDILHRAQRAGASTIEIQRDPAVAAENADVIYTDVWTSMGQEVEAAKRKKAFKNYQVNEHLLALAKQDCLVMHCMPAHREEEITVGVLDGKQSVIFDQAENRLHIQKAIMTKLIEQYAGKD
ncbi:MAG: ornithine carbamoyltransferase [Ignavibacteriae bacterium]|nr:ornithine carbamoyltransferase [Ignavibacteriota bacterium]